MLKEANEFYLSNSKGLDRLEDDFATLKFFFVAVWGLCLGGYWNLISVLGCFNSILLALRHLVWLMGLSGAVLDLGTIFLLGLVVFFLVLEANRKIWLSLLMEMISLEGSMDHGDILISGITIIILSSDFT